MKDIRSNFVKESLLDYENLANSIKENSSDIVKSLLSEAIKETYTKLLTEEDENEYEVEEVDDTESEDTNDAEEVNEEPIESELEQDDEPSVEGGEESETDEEFGGEEESSEGDEWAEFDKYKISDDEYDFSQADDEEIVKVYRLMKDDDQVLVNVDKETNKVELKDNQTGAEYLIDLGSNNGSSEMEEPLNDNFNDTEADSEIDYNEENMNESKVYELVLNEYDSHVGYTDNYQKKDVMTTPGTEEPGKNVNDWDAGVPKGKSKPWVGKGESKPFDNKVKSELSEEEGASEEMVEEEVVDEATNVGGFVQQNSTSKSHVPNSNGRNARNASKGGVKIKGTADPRYSSATNESKEMIQKVNKILKENEELKKALGRFKEVLQEAAVTNFSLGQITRLFTENTTSKEEKKEIINRFDKEVKTIEEAKQMFDTISRELQKKNTMNINEDKQFTANGSNKINETPIYQSKEVINSLDLMHRICK